jgi:hypothetical protein
MQKSRLGRGTAVIAAACGLAGAGAGTAVAAPGGHATAAAPSITITTKSGLPKVGGHTLVTFLGTQRTATISGSVTGATAGDPATLLAKAHGASTYSQAGTPVKLGSTGTYSFKVTPSVATSYEVQVGSGTSGSAMVYVTPHASVTGKRSCTRPVCHIKLRVWVKVPSAAYAKEAAKHWYLYSRLRLSAGREPAAFKALELNHSATASKATKLHSYEFVVTLRYAFKIGNDAFRWAVNFCTRDSETADGIGLPGTHGCGNKWISATSAYLG